MRLPKLASQSPQCEGYHKDRILFNNRGPSRQIYYKVRKSDDKLEYQMNAGSAHGITEEAKFALYRDRDSFSGPPSAVLIAQTPMAFSTTLISAGDNDSSVSIKEGFVRQTHAGVGEDLRLYVIMDERLLKVFESLSKEMDRNDDRKRRIKLVERKEDAELAIDIDSQEDVVVFDMRDLCGRTYRVPKTVKLLVDEFLADDVYAVINAAVHYYYHLRRSPVKEMFGKKVDIEFLKLKKTDEFDYETFSFAVVPDPDGGNLNVAGNVDVFVDDDAMYGMRITSRLPPKAPELYCSVFFFDSDFSIVSYYEPGIAGGHVDASLKPNSKGAVTIGFGAGGVPARRYHLETGNDSDVGFLKVFLSTEPLDLSHICQRSPFDGLRKEK
ncbi:hypothetical protein EW026_g152 [Hermanssonia centrifuga]|uniref:Uncharacterized protein n=1 Tax=Hermanssonia centrifuga TaxID=98765 RepID=A0A4S4L069_9APHY|nr:hypothetical protein EW026_g152 [Hermanssonia centrifuga]